MEGKKCWVVLIIICHAIAFGLIATTVIGDSWAVIKLKNGAHVMANEKVVSLNGEVTGHYGLWNFCMKNTSLCFRINHFYNERNTDWFKACQIAATTATMFAFTAFIAALLNPCCIGCAGAIASLNMFLACVCMTGACGIFTAKETTNLDNLMEKREWGWTYIVAWSGTAVSLFASIVSFLSYSPRKERSEVESLFV